MRNLVRNQTEYPDSDVKALVLDVLKQMDVRGVCVTVKHWRHGDSIHASGWYRPHWYPSRGEDREQISVTLPRLGTPIAPYEPYKRIHTDCPTFDLTDWREALVAIVAHEGQHARQTPRNGYRSSRAVKRDGGTGARARYVESEADMAAYRYVKRHRAANA